MTKKLSFLILLLTSLPGAFAEANRHLGVLLPLGTQQVDTNRFQSTHSYTNTVREMRRRLARHKNMSLSDEINLPHVRTCSFINADRSSSLMAINIYANVQNGITEIFFVVRSK